MSVTDRYAENPTDARAPDVPALVVAATACASVRPSVRPPTTTCCAAAKATRSITKQTETTGRFGNKPWTRRDRTEKEETGERRGGTKKNKREEANKQTKAPLEKGNGEEIERRF